MNPRSLYHYVTAPAPRYMLRLALLKKILVDHLPRQTYGAMEIGPGLGDVSHFLADDPYCSTMTLVDFSSKSIAKLEQRFGKQETEAPKTVLIQSELMNIPHTSVDVLLAFEVLEHIVEDQLALDKIYDLIAPRGKFVLSVPAYQRKWQKQDVCAGHIRRYERQELHDKLLRSGFTDIQILDYGFPLTALMYPFKQVSYEPDVDQTEIKRTEESGIDRPFFSKFSPFFLLPLYAPFMLLQSLFLNRDLGDGFVAIANKN